MQLTHQFLRFCVVGGLAFFVDVGVLYFFQSQGFDLYTSRLFSFIAAATFSWLGNRLFTFETSSKKIRHLPGEWLKYLFAMLLGGSVNYGVYALAISLIAYVHDHPWLGVAAGTGCGLVVNFILARKILFVNRQAV